jgi:predicted acyl esterase
VFSKNWQVSRRKYGIIRESSVSVQMSDGITIDAEIFRPNGILYKAGHRIGLSIKCVDDERPTNFLQAIAMGHLWRQSASRVTVYHSSEFPSHLLLPVTKGNRIGTYMSGGKLSEQFFPYRKF